MIKFKEYTDKLDYPVVVPRILRRISRVDFSGGDVYTGLARKLGLIDGKDLLIAPEGRHRQARSSHLYIQITFLCFL